MVGFRIQQRVQRLFDRRPNHFIQMRLSASFIDLYYRTQVPLDPVFRPSSRFHGWLHRARLRGLAPPACTNLHASNSNQMCERNPTLSALSGVDSSRIIHQVIFVSGSNAGNLACLFGKAATVQDWLSVWSDWSDDDALVRSS